MIGIINSERFVRCRVSLGIRSNSHKKYNLNACSLRTNQQLKSVWSAVGIMNIKMKKILIRNFSFPKNGTLNTD